MRTIIYKQKLRSIVVKPRINTFIVRRPPSQTYSGGGTGIDLPPQSDGMSAVLKPTAGKIFIRNATTGDYQELIALRQGGVDRLTLSSTHLAFSALPAD